MSFLNFAVYLLCKKHEKYRAFQKSRTEAQYFESFGHPNPSLRLSDDFTKNYDWLKKKKIFPWNRQLLLYKYSFKYYIQRKRRYIQDKFQSAHIVCRQVYQHFNGQFICLYAHLPDKIVLLHFFREINFTKLPAEYF